MLLALLEDAARVPGWSVCTTWDSRLGVFPLANVDVCVVGDSQDELRACAELAGTSDGVYVIAPELDDQLTIRRRQVAERGGRMLNSSAPALRSCSDKLATFERLRGAGVPTIPTRQLVPGEQLDWGFPAVVKPRFGAGSHETFLVDDVLPLMEHALRLGRDPVEQRIVQPFVAGRALSVAVIVRDGGEPVEVWPVAEQHLSSDGRFQYLGGRVPARDVPVAAIAALAERTVRIFPGLRGYVGLDIILPDDAPERPLVVEVNPRLTTSYLGYRAIADQNLAPLVLLARQIVPPGAWRAAEVTFDSAGRMLT
jgi:predicted ATP-grasp superfamily ATP-dependent carboligase